MLGGCRSRLGLCPWRPDQSTWATSEETGRLDEAADGPDVPSRTLRPPTEGPRMLATLLPGRGIDVRRERSRAGQCVRTGLPGA